MASSSEIEIEVENQPSPATPHASSASSSAAAAYPTLASSSASSSAAADPTSSSSGDYGYDVFINHRGPDTKKTFASHLYHRLLSDGFRPFLDHQELQEGLDFPSQIEHAIRSASVHVAVFSPKYAESEWCLRELLLMLESRAPIIPVFYHVQPADLRWTGEDKTGVYAQALHRLQLKKTYCSQTHQDKPRYDPATIQKWRDALSSVADISGFDLDGKFNGDEGEMLDKLVGHVVKMAKKTPLHVAKYPTGLDEKVEDFEAKVLLRHKRTSKVQMVGIVGLGGVGKTTLAIEIFNRKHSEYNKSYFLSDVREKAKSSLHTLQSELLKGLNLFNGPIDNKHQGTEMLRKSLSSSQVSQVFVILDDIDHRDQVDGLLPDRDGLPNDSLILITSRDRGVLEKSGVEESSIYELKGLDSKHSQELFCSYAFCQPYPLRGFEDLVNMFLRTCDGLPLSLKVFGALLFREKDKSHWKDILDRVHEVPDDILDRLRISYDALSGEERQIFLDIACFFIGKDKNTAITLWKGSLGFRNLQGKCLVEVDSKNVIHMHDHLRDMGREIAKDESPRRLWHPTENIDDWLQQQSSVISEARGISMDGNNEVADVLIRSPMFSWFQRKISAMKLQLLSSEGHLLERILRKVHSPNLTWLSWCHCPYSYLPSWIPMKNLRVLRVQGRLLETLWLGESQAPLQLEELEIIEAVHLSNIPKSLGQLKHLRIYVGKYCPMESLPESFGNLANLQHMDLSWCMKLERLPDSFGNLASLQHMTLSHCSILERLPDSFGNLASLQHMDLSWCEKLERLPDSFGNLASLQHMTLSHCSILERLPDSFGNLASLQHMDLSWCEKLERLPDSFGNLASLQHMTLSHCSILERLPDSFGNLASLQHMDLSSCEKLERLPDSFGNLASLQHMDISWCMKFERLPDSFGNLANLQHMDLSWCMKFERLPDSFGNLASLQHMDLSSCKKLERLPDSFGNLASLQHMDLSGCDKLESLPDSVGNLASLQHMDLPTCKKLERLPDSFGNMASLQHMNLSRCKKLERLPDSFGNLASLQHMNLSGCKKLERLPDSFGNLASLQHMDLSRCKLERLPDSFGNLASLQHMNLSTCKKLERLPDSFGNLASLQHMNLSGCKKLKRLPDSFGCLSSLKSFKVRCCSNLTISSDTFRNITRLEHIDLSGCEKIEVWPSQLALQRSLKTLELTGTNFKELPRAVEVPRGLEVLRIGSPLVDTLSLGDLRKLKELTLKDGRELKHLSASVGLSPHLTSLEVGGCTALELPFKLVEGQRETETLGTLMKSDSSINHNYMFGLQRLILQEDTEISKVSFDEGVCPNLGEFILEGCSNLAEVGTLPSTLHTLHIENCGELEELITIGIKSLVHLRVWGCVKLKSIRDLAQLTKLQYLYVYWCDELEELEGVEYCKSLEKLSILGCPKLQWGKGVVKRLRKKKIIFRGPNC